MNHFFITGGSGFIGSHLVDALMQRRQAVTVFDNFSSGKKEFLETWSKESTFRLIQGDLLDRAGLEQAIAGHDTVVHLAANSDIMKAMEEPRLDFEQGIRATFHLLEAMRREKIGKLVYLSGSGVYGDTGETFVGENYGPLIPGSMYGAAKLASEAMIGAYANLYGLQAWILRPANIIGPRPTHGVIYDFICKLKTDPSQLAVLGDGSQSKSYLHVEDLVSALLFVLEKSSGAVNLFNVASETYITVREIAEMVIEEMHLKNVRLEFGKTERGWKGDIPKYRLAIDKIRSLGWNPRYSSEDAVRRTIRQILESQGKRVS